MAHVVNDLKRRFKLGRVLFVGDRGMLSDSNLGHLMEEDLGMIVAHPVRCNALAQEVISGSWADDNHVSWFALFKIEQLGLCRICALVPSLDIFLIYLTEREGEGFTLVSG